MRCGLLVAVITFAFLLLAPLAGPVRAVDGWCADDPVLAINGITLDLQVQMPATEVLTLRSTTTTVVIPSNVHGQVLVDDVSAFPMTTRVAAIGSPWSGNGALPITVLVDVTAATSYPERVVATQPLTTTQILPNQATATGTANTRLVLSMALFP
jgi:hypothetical protein